MAYIDETDLKQYITQAQLDRMNRPDDATDYISKAINEAQNYIKRRLNYKYDMDTELAKTAEDRDETLMRIMSMLAIYNLTIPFELHDDEGKYYQQYQRALEDIANIENGTLLGDMLTFRDEDKQQILYGKSNDSELEY